MRSHISMTFRAGLILLMVALTLSACSLFNQATDGTGGQAAAQGAVLGRVVTAEAIGQNAAPVNETNTFSTSAERIYVVAEAQRIDPGTSMFARWSRDGRPFEDSQPVTANRAYQDTFVEFHLEPVQGNFDPGQYSVQIFVNGNPAQQATFTVR